MNILIYPYKLGSGSVRAIKAKLVEMGHRCIVTQRVRPHRHVVHWGKFDGDRSGLNTIEHTQAFTNKLTFFSQIGSPYLETPYAPLWTNSLETARLIVEGGGTIVERHSLTGTNGVGIRIVSAVDDLQPAPLYVLYQKKTDEYRLHIVKGTDGQFRVLHHQKKVARDTGAVQNWKIRNVQNGFFYQQYGYEVPAKVTDAAIGLVSDCFAGIDFVALDVIYHRPTDRAYVLEGNTAPGLEGSSVQKYADYFAERFS